MFKEKHDKRKTLISTIYSQLPSEFKNKEEPKNGYSFHSTCHAFYILVNKIEMEDDPLGVMGFDVSYEVLQEKFENNIAELMKILYMMEYYGLIEQNPLDGYITLLVG